MYGDAINEPGNEMNEKQCARESDGKNGNEHRWMGRFMWKDRWSLWVQVGCFTVACEVITN